jgi:hypothetical protein
MNAGLVGLLLLLLGAVLVGIVPALWVHRREEGRAPELRLLLAATPIVLLVVAGLLASFVLQVTAHDYSAARLAQSTGLVQGHGLYHGATSGPALSTIYGPVSVLLYVPAALLDDITASMFAASVTNILCFLLPLFVLFLCGRGRESRTFAVAFFALTAAGMLAFESMRQMLGSIHVDGPAVGLGILSCALLIGTTEAPGFGRLLAAALLAGLSAWTKQVDAPLALGQLAWLGLAHGRGTAGRYLVALLLAAGATTAAIVLVFGLEAMFFNLLTVPGGHAFQPLGPVAREAFLMSLAPLAVLAWVAGTSREPGRALRSEWALLLFAFVALAPTSFLARAKQGGFLNSYHSQYFLVAAAGLALATSVARGGTPARRLACVAAGVAALVFLPYGRVASKLENFRAAETNRQETALALARAHPGEVFFPWNPLVTLFSDRELYHFEWGVRDRDLAGHRMTDEHVRAHVPANLRYLLYPRRVAVRRRGVKEVLREHLPGFDSVVELAGAEDYTVYTRSP